MRCTINGTSLMIFCVFSKTFEKIVPQINVIYLARQDGAQSFELQRSAHGVVPAGTKKERKTTRVLLSFLVLLRRIELRTPWLKVKCSTSWATGAYSFLYPQTSLRRICYAGIFWLHRSALMPSFYQCRVTQDAANAVCELRTPWLKVKCSTSWATGA